MEGEYTGEGAEIRRQIDLVEQKVNRVEQQVDQVEQQLGSTGVDDIAKLSHLRREKEQLRRKEEQLRREKEQFLKVWVVKEKSALLERQDGPILLKNISVILPPVTEGANTQVKVFKVVNKAYLKEYLERGGYGGAILDGEEPTKIVSVADAQLVDGMTIVADPLEQAVEARVKTLEGFASSIVRAVEGEAAEAAYRYFKSLHPVAEILEVREIYSDDGSKREIDGAAYSKDCAMVLESKVTLGPAAVYQLAETIEFIRTKSLREPGRHLQKSKITGLLAGATIVPNAAEAKELFRLAKEREFGIFVNAGKSLTLSSSRTPRGPPARCCLLKMHPSQGVTCRPPFGRVRLV